MNVNVFPMETGGEFQSAMLDCRSANSFSKSWICLFDAWKKFKTYSAKSNGGLMMIDPGLIRKKYQLNKPKKITIEPPEHCERQNLSDGNPK